MFCGVEKSNQLPTNSPASCIVICLVLALLVVNWVCGVTGPSQVAHGASWLEHGVDEGAVVANPRLGEKLLLKKKIISWPPNQLCVISTFSSTLDAATKTGIANTETNSARLIRLS